jgi:threonine aldolase
MAQLMAERLADIPGVSLLFKPESNAVFAELPARVATALRAKGWRFYQFIGSGGCRLMCAWDTKRETVERFVDDVRALAASI